MVEQKGFTWQYGIFIGICIFTSLAVGEMLGPEILTMMIVADLGIIIMNVLLFKNYYENTTTDCKDCGHSLKECEKARKWGLTQTPQRNRGGCCPDCKHVRRPKEKSFGEHMDEVWPMEAKR